MKYRKKPVVIDAIRYDSEDKAYELAEMCGGYVTLTTGLYSIVIPTLEGDHLASLGDWIIKGVKGEFYPIKHDIFEMTYEEVKEDDAEI